MNLRALPCNPKPLFIILNSKKTLNSILQAAQVNYFSRLVSVVIAKKRVNVAGEKKRTGLKNLAGEANLASLRAT